jgi:hypothetical protein
MFSLITNNRLLHFVRKYPFYVEHGARAILEEVSVEDLM